MKEIQVSTSQFKVYLIRSKIVKSFLTIYGAMYWNTTNKFCLPYILVIGTGNVYLSDKASTFIFQCVHPSGVCQTNPGEKNLVEKCPCGIKALSVLRNE